MPKGHTPPPPATPAPPPPPPGALGQDRTSADGRYAQLQGQKAAWHALAKCMLKYTAAVRRSGAPPSPPAGVPAEQLAPVGAGGPIHVHPQGMSHHVGLMARFTISSSSSPLGLGHEFPDHGLIGMTPGPAEKCIKQTILQLPKGALSAECPGWCEALGRELWQGLTEVAKPTSMHICCESRQSTLGSAADVCQKLDRTPARTTGWLVHGACLKHGHLWSAYRCLQVSSARA